MRDWRARFYINRVDPRLSSPLPTAPHFYDGTFLLGRNLPSQFHRHVLEIDHIISSDATLRAFSVTSKCLERFRGDLGCRLSSVRIGPLAADRSAVKS
ncbi:MAG: hypothetical protein E6G91_12955 [Alphaproteobacteria bacterium]|nr:MAG: hypothetical protein E6G91_12955 [Alphaproteobacteria bacterium]